MSLRAQARGSQDPWTVEGLMKSFKGLHSYDGLTKEFELNKRPIFERFLKNLADEPLFPKQYKQLGISPRVQPISIPIIMFPVPISLLLGAGWWLFRQGANSNPVAVVVRPMLKPLLTAALGGAAIMRPRTAILTPLRAVRQALAFTLGLSTTDTVNRALSSSSIEMCPAFTVVSCEQFVKVGIRNDVYGLMSVSFWLVIVMGTCVIAYRVSLKLVYLFRADLEKNWAKMDRERELKEFNERLLLGQGQTHLKPLNETRIVRSFKG